MSDSLTSILVSTKHPVVNQMSSYLTECKDAYGGLAEFRLTRIESYLPPNFMEEPDSYTGRISRCQWGSFFQRAVNGFAGILSQFTMSDTAVIQPDTPTYENVDGQGNSLKTVLLEADTLALRDGWCAIIVEFPQREELNSRADEIEQGVTPYLQVVERSSVINWHVDNNQLVLLVIERLVDSYDNYATKTSYQYWEYVPGAVRVWDKKDETLQLIAVYNLVSSDGELLNEIPVVFYPYSKIPNWSEIPPLHDLALDNFAHFQETSDYREVRYKCNLPVPVRKGFWQSGTANAPPLIIGANSVIDVPVDGDFYFREPTGVAIASTREAIKDLESRMLRRSLAFFGDSSGQMTVDEVYLRSNQTRSQLMILASRKESAVQSIFRLWAMWLGLSDGGKRDGGTIVVNRTAMRSPLHTDMIRVFSDMVIEGLLSRESLLAMLLENGVMPDGFNISNELQATTIVEDE